MSQIIKKNSTIEIHDIGKMGLDLSMVESQTFQDQAEAFIERKVVLKSLYQRQVKQVF